MKTKITTIILIFALGYSSFAQQQAPRGGMRQQLTPEQQVQMAQRQTERMKESLKLDEEQEKEVRTINLKYAVLRAQIAEAARAEEGIDLRALLTELEEKREGEILPILNAEQIEIFITQKNEQQERQQQMRQRGEERRRP